MLQRSRHYPRPSIKSEPITSTFVSSRFFSSSGPVTAKKPAERPQSTASETLKSTSSSCSPLGGGVASYQGTPSPQPTLDAEVFRKTSTCSVGVPHHEVLEWIGDRELNSAAALVVAVMSPTGVVQKDLGWHSKMWGPLITRAFAERLAKRFGFEKRIALAQNTLANRFEAYVGALWCEQGSDAVIRFLAPLFKEEVESLSKPLQKSHPTKVPKMLEGPETRREETWNPYEPLEYSSLADAEASFLLHLKQFGWIKYLNRGRHRISFMPEDRMGVQVEFGPGGAGQGSLRRLLEEAVKVDSVRIKNDVSASAPNPMTHDQLIGPALPLPIRFKTQDRAVAGFRLALEAAGLESHLNLPKISASRKKTTNLPMSPTLPGYPPIKTTCANSARQYKLAWRTIVSQAIQNGAIIIEK